MASLTTQRCLHHTLREAVARCPGCQQFFCRECITEHGERMLCAACLRKLVAALPVRQNRFRQILHLIECVLGITILWLFFFLLGQALLALPNSFHEGTVWAADWGETP